MKRLLAIVIALLLYAGVAHADSVRICNLGVLLDDVDMSGAEATRTIDISAAATCYKADNTTVTGSKGNPATFSYLVLVFDLTNDSGATLLATHTIGFSTATASPGICAVAGGTCTSSAGSVTSMATGTTSIIRAHRYGIRGYPVHKIITALAGASGDDDLTVTGYLVD